MLRLLSSCRGRPRHLILVRELSRLRFSDDLTTHVVCLPRACPVPDGAADELTQLIEVLEKYSCSQHPDVIAMVLTLAERIRDHEM